jgi:hypothetical protein
MRQRSIVIDCDECELQGTDACDDCVVTFVLRDHSDEAVIVDIEEARALRLLAEGGLVPRLRHPNVEIQCSFGEG